MEKKKHGLVTVREAAGLLMVDAHSVYRQIWAHRLRAIRRGGRWLIPYHEIQRYAERRRKRSIK